MCILTFRKDVLPPSSRLLNAEVVMSIRREVWKKSVQSEVWTGEKNRAGNVPIGFRFWLSEGPTVGNVQMYYYDASLWEWPLSGPRVGRCANRTVYVLWCFSGILGEILMPKKRLLKPHHPSFGTSNCRIAKRICTKLCIFLFCRNSPEWTRTSSFTRFLDHTQWHTTVGRTPLDEWSARRRDLYLKTHNTHNR